MRKITGELKARLDGLSAEFVQEGSFSLAVGAAKARAVPERLDEMILPPLYNSRTGLPARPGQGLVVVDSEMPEREGSPALAFEVKRPADHRQSHRPWAGHRRDGFIGGVGLA